MEGEKLLFQYTKHPGDFVKIPVSTTDAPLRFEACDAFHVQHLLLSKQVYCYKKESYISLRGDHRLKHLPPYDTTYYYAITDGVNRFTYTNMQRWKGSINAMIRGNSKLSWRFIKMKYGIIVPFDKRDIGVLIGIGGYQ